MKSKTRIKPKPVYYLSYSDIPYSEGLVFPNELQAGTYAPGIWVIDIEPLARLADSFEFDAVLNNEVTSYSMDRINRSVFRVQTEKQGQFYFRIMNIFFRYQRYIGKSKLIQPESRLFQVVSMDIQKLSRVCLQERFFFVGRIDNELIKTSH